MIASLSHSHFLCVSVCDSFSLSSPVSVSLSLCPCLSLCVCLSFFVFLSLFLCLCVRLSLFLCLSVCLSLFVSPSLSLSLSLSLFFCLSLCLSVSLSVCVFVYFSVSVFVSLSLSLIFVVCNLRGFHLLFFSKNSLVNATAWFNNQAYHSVAVALAAVENAVLRSVLGDNVTLTTINHPLPRTVQESINDLSR